MNHEIDYSIQDFSHESDIKLLKEIYLLNQANTPEVGNLNSVSQLQSLLTKSKINLYVYNEIGLIGFIVCFREGSSYLSENYKFFSKTEKNFFYIDRIAIDKKFRRKRIAHTLYKKIEKLCIRDKLPLCCEVNTLPLNKPSINFHKKLGFIDVGKNEFAQNSVVYFKKKYK